MTAALTLRYLLEAMATYGDDQEALLGDVSDADAHRGGDLPAPIMPPPVLPSASPLPAPARSAVPISSLPAPLPTGAAGQANSYTDIRAVHEATTQQLRERREAGVNGVSGRSVAIACAVVVLGGTAFVLGAALL